MTKGEKQHRLSGALTACSPNLEQRRAFMKLPLETRRKIMAEQANELAEHYLTDFQWRVIEGGDLVKY